MTEPRTPTAVDEFAEVYFAKYLELNPTEAAYLGIPGYETDYGDYSPAGKAERAAHDAAALRDLEKLTPADSTDEVTLHAMRERLGLAAALHEAGREDVNNIATAAHEARQILDLMPQSTDQDFAHIAGRLRNLPAALQGWWESLVAARETGQVSAARQVQAAAGQFASYAAEEGALRQLVTAAEAAQVSDGVVDDVRNGVQAAAEAYLLLSQRLTERLLPAAPAQDAVGADYYRLASQSFTGTRLDLEETYQWGLEELARLVEAQKQVAEAIRPGASIAEAKEVLNSDPARKLHGTDALQQWMQQLSDQAIADLRDTHFDIPSPMDQLECRIAPTTDGGVYYTGPSDDFSRPGRMWWSVPPQDTEFTTWAETTTVYHEGVPGHHLQIATAVLVKDRLNSWRRNGCFTSGYAEGWALYAEDLMAELGYLEDPGDMMGMLDMQRMRAARVVFDIGLHCGFRAPAEWGSAVWNPVSGRAFLSEHLPISEGQLEFELTRYLGWPGQAPSYKVGQRVFQQLRADREAAQGADFDLKAFHTELLQLGSLGLDTLRWALSGRS
ncbi:DUF885 domain-containing protein [Nesterenkonia alkaliphila]|uniref:DUF885 family protein n=1 Tax=Nesterenkonia alkaliphila TaxID=1463631 RepID=A0A7K1UEH3_9MICC|nr:DUF885 domain-containing protein [Nesterenkonia alkaliphila]MVT24858.1 DUF885 family protein [Nesterenkonia alkaliphila]GFZ92755.1 hypothetical protein GCM10011359_22680 [Nesterenkonia alkaliphila]